jgi:hypothetical protein
VIGGDGLGRTDRREAAVIATGTCTVGPTYSRLKTVLMSYYGYSSTLQ